MKTTIALDLDSLGTSIRVKFAFFKPSEYSTASNEMVSQH